MEDLKIATIEPKKGIFDVFGCFEEESYSKMRFFCLSLLKSWLKSEGNLPPA